MAIDHTAKAFDADLQEITRKVAEMGGLAERQIADAVDALVDRDMRSRASASSPPIRDRRPAARRSRKRRSSPSRGGSRWRSTCAKSSAPCGSRNDLERIGDLAKNIAKRVVALDRDLHPQKLIRGVEHMADAGAGAAQGRCSTPMPAATSTRRWRSGAATRKSTRVCTSLFRELLTYMMEDPRNISVLHASDVLRQEHRAHGRPRHQHRRDRLLHDRGPADRRRASRRATPPRAFAQRCCTKYGREVRHDGATS